MVKTLNDINKTSHRVFKNGNRKAISLGTKTIQLANFEVGDKAKFKQMRDGIFSKRKKKRLKIELSTS
ncbi:AbrB family transcriptional regulator [Staphylococcus epidermidis]